jgi:iron complex outermembrane receptor protein
LEFANPVYGYDGFDHDPPVVRDDQATGNNLSFSVQDEIRLMDDRVIIVGGVRYDDYEVGGFDFRSGTARDPGAGDNVSYKFGAIYKPQEDSSIYYNYSETFEPDFSRNPDGTGFLPQVGAIHEVGVKASLFDAKINLGVAGYTQDIKNVKALHPDPDLAEQGFRVQSDVQTVDGIEVEAHLNPTDNWRLYFSSSWISVTHPDDLIQRTQPKETYAFFTRYTFEDETPLQGLQIGGGIHYSGQRPGDSGNSFFLPSFWSADVVVRYQLNPKTVFTLNVNNVTDERFLNRSINRNQILNNLPRSIRFKITYTW